MCVCRCVTSCCVPQAVCGGGRPQEAVCKLRSHSQSLQVLPVSLSPVTVFYTTSYLPRCCLSSIYRHFSVQVAAALTKRHTLIVFGFCCCVYQEGPQDGPDPDGLRGGSHRVSHRVPQPRPGREPPPASVLLQVYHLSAFVFLPPEPPSATITYLWPCFFAECPDNPSLFLFWLVPIIFECRTKWLYASFLSSFAPKSVKNQLIFVSCEPVIGLK